MLTIRKNSNLNWKTALFSLGLLFCLPNFMFGIKVMDPKATPCIETIEPLPYDANFMYMAYFGYTVTILDGYGTPGVDLPNMHLYAYLQGDFSQQITLSSSLGFSDANGVLMTAEMTFNLEDITAFLSICQTFNTDAYREGKYEVAPVAIVNGNPVLYESLYPQLFGAPLDPNTTVDESFHWFVCAGAATSLSSNSEIDYSNSSEMEAELFQEEMPYSENSIGVYPNPFTDKIMVDLDMELSDIQSIDILDFSGKKVYYLEGLSSTQSIEIGLDNFPDGIYYVRINLRREQIVKKIVKTN